ncbi:alanyl-tRNA synthetase [Auriculariales sp. MPI-PUGE-AT-0066]|nr:alanyl-tRNA synthetase [Auriculariales sp. MPI-PUGE-AT-0066]
MSSNLQPYPSPPYNGPWTSTRIRQTFLDFFQERNHVIFRGSSTIPVDDPTLLFTNAGMNQFKGVFLNTIKPEARRKEALMYAWQLLTEVYKLDPSRLYVTYFEGLPSSNLPPDFESRDFWLTLGVDPSHILPGSPKDNFWEMGRTGPCGPSSEIHYDLLPPSSRNQTGIDARKLVNGDDPTVIEIWNVVFVTYMRGDDGLLGPLPHRHIDTGLGFERLVSALQETASNYDTDVFVPLLRRIHEIVGPSVREYSGRFGEEDEGGIDTAYRIVADHVRTLTVAIGDGKIQRTLDAEEQGFSKILARGARVFMRSVEKTKRQGGTTMSGSDVWHLYESFGFPVDLTCLMARDVGLEINEDEVKEAQNRSKEASRGGSVGHSF